MGNQLGQTVQSRQFTDQSLKDFEYQTVYVEEIEDKCFGQIRVHRRRNALLSNNNIFIMEKANYNDQKVEFAQLYAESQTRLELTHKNLLQFLGYDFVNQKDFCTTSLRSRLFFEYYYHDLGLEVQRRTDCQEHFNEEELWYMLDSVVQVCCFLQENQLFHGDLRPSSIKLTPEGFVKIGDHGLINPMKNGFYKTLIRAENGYLSPEQLSYLMLGLTETKYNVFKQEVFTLGVTMLECATLRDVTQIYDWDKMMIRTDVLKNLIDFASNFYSSELIAVFNLMLQLEDSYRPDFHQLKTYVKNEFASRVSTNPTPLQIHQNEQVFFQPNQSVHQSTPHHAPNQGTINPQHSQLLTSNVIAAGPPDQHQTGQRSMMVAPINSTHSQYQQYPHQQQQQSGVLQQTIIPQQFQSSNIQPPHLQHTIINPPTHLQQTVAHPQSHLQQTIISSPPPPNTVYLNNSRIVQQGEVVYLPPVARQSQVIVQRPFVNNSSQLQLQQQQPMQTMIQPQQQIVNQQAALNSQHHHRVMTTNTYITNQIPNQSHFYEKQETFGAADGADYNQTQKKSVKFNQNTEITSENYRFSGSHEQHDYQNLKRSQIQFNSDLDRRVTEALEMTRQTIKKNQSVPNIFSGDSPIKQFENKM